MFSAGPRYDSCLRIGAEMVSMNSMKTGHSVTFIVLVNSHQRIDSVVVVSQYRLESFVHEIKCNGMTSFMEFMLQWIG